MQWTWLINLHYLRALVVPGWAMLPAGRAVTTRSSYAGDGDGGDQEKDPQKPESRTWAKVTVGSTLPW